MLSRDIKRQLLTPSELGCKFCISHKCLGDANVGGAQMLYIVCFRMRQAIWWRNNSVCTHNYYGRKLAGLFLDLPIQPAISFYTEDTSTNMKQFSVSCKKPHLNGATWTMWLRPPCLTLSIHLNMLESLLTVLQR